MIGTLPWHSCDRRVNQSYTPFRFGDDDRLGVVDAGLSLWQHIWMGLGPGNTWSAPRSHIEVRPRGRIPEQFSTKQPPRCNQTPHMYRTHAGRSTCGHASQNPDTRRTLACGRLDGGASSTRPRRRLSGIASFQRDRRSSHTTLRLASLLEGSATMRCHGKPPWPASPRRSPRTPPCGGGLERSPG